MRSILVTGGSALVEGADRVCVYREAESLLDLCLRRSAEIHKSLRPDRMLQVRWHGGKLLTFRYPAPHGHGVRGVLVGVYAQSITSEMIHEDLLDFLRSHGETKRSAHA